METSFWSALAVFGLLLIFAPTVLLFFASARAAIRFPKFPAYCIATGGLLLTISSLDLLFVFLVGSLSDAEGLARFSLVSPYIFGAINYLALLLIAVGILLLTGRRSVAQLEN